MEGEFWVAGWLAQPLLDSINGPGGTTIRVEPKVMDVLVYLAHHPGEVLLKESIIQAVWHGTFVTDDVLTGAISDLRHAFRDDARHPKFIQTVPKRGYRLIAPVSFLQAPAARYVRLAPISRGARSEVYLARDNELRRRVALKLLHTEKAQDEKACRRLLHEARAAARLDHPFICKIYDVGKIDGVPFIVMEHVEGQTLEERLKQGPMELKEALQAASEVAEALDEAHQKVIAHLNLKPANIILTSQGHVKITDFGLARLTRRDEGDSSDPSISRSDPVSAPQSLAYLAPEQLCGEEAGPAADIFTFGLIFYEMVTGVHPFKKASRVETGVAILNDGPYPLSRHLDSPPSALEQLLHRMLARSPSSRCQKMQDIRAALSDIMEEVGHHNGHAASTPSEPARAESQTAESQRRIGKSTRLIAGTAILAMATAAALLFYTFLRRVDPPGDTLPLYALIKIPSGYELGSAWAPMRTAMVLAQDDNFVVYSAGLTHFAEANKTRLFLHRIHVPQVSPIEGTEGASMPFLSPDSSWIGFWADGKLLKLPVAGGVPELLCDTPLPLGATWGEDGTIVFASASDAGLSRVAAGGVETLTRPNRTAGESRHLFPTWLPDRRHLLFTIEHDSKDLGPEVAVLDVQSRTWQGILPDASDARYAACGLLIFLRGDRLFAAGFNLKELRIDGDPTPVLEQLGQAGDPSNVADAPRTAQFCISRSGALFYVPGGSQPATEIVFIHNWFTALKTLVAAGNK